MQKILSAMLLFAWSVLPNTTMANDWKFSSTTEACFLSQSIEAIDPKIRHTSLVLGEFELVASSPNEYFGRVITTVEIVDRATDLWLRIKGSEPIHLKPHRPGGQGLRYVEFNADREQGRLLSQALLAGKLIAVEFRFGLLRKVRGVVKPEGFSQQYMEFTKCTKSLAARR
jgi:hypothetical protein